MAVKTAINSWALETNQAINGIRTETLGSVYL